MKKLANSFVIANIIAFWVIQYIHWFAIVLYPEKPEVPRGDLAGGALLLSMITYAVTWLPSLLVALYWWAMSERRELRICLWAWLL
jgi:hypothetical protein